MSAPFDDRVARARSVPLEREVARRGIELTGKGDERVGACPRCGGTDRFAINIKKQVWNCRHCKPQDINGDVIGLVQWLDGVDFITACTTLAGDPPPNGISSGKDHTARSKKVVVEEYSYEDAQKDFPPAAPRSRALGVVDLGC